MVLQVRLGTYQTEAKVRERNISTNNNRHLIICHVNRTIIKHDDIPEDTSKNHIACHDAEQVVRSN